MVRNVTQKQRVLNHAPTFDFFRNATSNATWSYADKSNARPTMSQVIEPTRLVGGS